MRRAELGRSRSKPASLKRVSVSLRVACALIALLPLPAFANAGIGFFMLAIPAVLLFLIPAIVLEAPVLAAVLRLPFRRALSYSARANVRSTLYGLIFGIGFDIAIMAASGSSGAEPSKATATAVLIPMLFLSWWIEHRAVARLAAEIPLPRIAFATGVANLLSYTVMIACVWATDIYPQREAMSVRARVTEAVLAAASVKLAVTEYWELKNQLPADFRELPGVQIESGKYRVTIESGGRVTVLIDMPEQPDLDGKHIVYTPVPSPDTREMRWKCSAPEIQPKFLPVTCREP